MSYTPDENLMYTTPDTAWAEGAQQGNIHMYTNKHDPAQSRHCVHGDYFECPEELDRETYSCSRCGVAVRDRPALSPAAQSTLGAQVANILSAADRGEDMVNLPPHYARFKIEPMHFTVENGLNWFQGNVLKYILRYDAKNGMEDLRKAQRYLEMFIKWVDGDPDWWKHPNKEASHVGRQAG